ncbi:39S ribosomal protein L41, mitochondrial-like [Nomascus leucogenys]|uniref:39S ribosomal protein L41, mitochondrial-like n=1 Tax=Nomascus leucogenys TaxID=61853 RepID=UPI00122D86AE|nr:39S ribosomal protein L41, mitochondrial-like [Nomascus leucogenys]
MGVLAAAARCLVRGADRISKWTSKRGPRSFKGRKGRGAKGTGFLTSGWRFVQIKEMVPEFVVPALTCFKLKLYVSYRVPESEETSLTAAQLFSEAVARAIEKDFKDGTFDPDNLEKCGFEPTQEGKLFQLYPRNFLRWRGGGGAACHHLISIKRLCQLKKKKKKIKRFFF